MLAIDSGKAKLRKQQDAVLRNREITHNAAKAEGRAGKYVENKHESIANKERQKGKWMTADAFMTKLRSINKDVVLDPHPYRHQAINADKAVLNLLLPDGKKLYLFVCEGDWMPEWTSFTTKEILVPDEHGSTLWKKQVIPRFEDKRGWRTVLIRLIHMGIITLTDAERVFGPGNRESWKIMTGKGTGQLLI